MEALDGKRLCVSQSVFRLNIFVRAAAWGWEHFSRSMRMVAIFSGDLFSKKNSPFDSNDFFTLSWKHGEGSNYLFPNLFSDLIVFWEQESGNGSVWVGALGCEQYF